jgi:hypothetical protein
MKYMGLFHKKSKQEIEIEREISYRKAKATIKNYIDNCESIKKRYWEQGVESAKIGDEELLKRFAAGYFAMNDKIRKGKKLLLNMEGIKLQRETMHMSGDFVAFAKDMSSSILEGVDVKELAEMQLNLEKAIMKAEQVDMALSTSMDMTSEKILASPELDTNLSNIIKTMEGEAVAGESKMDIKIENGLKQVEDAMKKGG